MGARGVGIGGSKTRSLSLPLSPQMCKVCLLNASSPPFPLRKRWKRGGDLPLPPPLLLYFTQPIPFSPPSPSSSFPCGGFRAKKRRQRRRRDLTGGDGGRRREGETPPTKHSTTQIRPSLFFLLPLRTTNQPPAEGNACI